MNIKEMHYELKLKLNKIDSQQNRNLLIPEIDWKLNEAQDLFIKLVAFPRTYNSIIQSYGVDVTQLNIDSIRTLIKTESIIATEVSTSEYTIKLPEDYRYYLSANITASKDDCLHKELKFFKRQHDDRFNTSPFDKPSFEWGECNGVFNEDGVLIYTDGTFSISTCKLTYIRIPKYMHNAEDFNSTGYVNLKGDLLENTLDCELSEITHHEIVDLAVMLIAADLQLPDFNIKLNKIKINN